jgi:Uma2 family endonuclease
VDDAVHHLAVQPGIRQQRVGAEAAVLHQLGDGLDSLHRCNLSPGAAFTTHKQTIPGRIESRARAHPPLRRAGVFVLMGGRAEPLGEEVAVKAVMPIVPQDVLAVRKRTGADRFDEMWDGVLHMPPMPNFDHQDLEGELEMYLRLRWARPRGCWIGHQINVAPPGGWPDNYRVPDLVLLTPERFGINRNEYFEGAPDVVVEIHSPGDETYEKLPFYEELGVPEVWVIHRDSKEPEVYVLKRRRYKKQSAGRGGWLRSPGTGIELRASGSGKLAVRLAGDESTREDLPPD